ncbi:MAG TPA: hypothetical protein DCF62_00800 [Porticoccaceae bacterium]|nr:hypothetical protein [Porticoccaceae bacterium]HCO59349.1 hypothetical protein [Porticoccaceae bacterium]
MNNDCGADMGMLQRQIFLLCLVLIPGLASGNYQQNTSSVGALSPHFHPFDRGPHPRKALILAEHEEESRGQNGDKRGKRWEELTPRQRRKIEKRYEKYKSLPPGDQERIKKARQQYRELPPEKRRELRDQYRKSKSKQNNR